MQFVRKVYSMNPKAGRYPAISFPPELAKLLTDFVVLETLPEGILIRPAKIEPAHSG
jgi:hypothetical protein